jgi:hypothetical protein
MTASEREVIMGYPRYESSWLTCHFLSYEYTHHFARCNLEDTSPRVSKTSFRCF